jgi:hypothetical protein
MPVLFARLLLPVAGAVILTAGHFSSTMAAKDLPLFAPSYSWEAGTPSPRAPLRRRVITVQHQGPCFSLI